MESWKQRQLDEYEVLTYILESKVKQLSEPGSTPLKLELLFYDESFDFTTAKYCPQRVTIHLPVEYPENTSKQPSLDVDYLYLRDPALPEMFLLSRWLDKSLTETLPQQLRDTYTELLSEAVFEFYERAKVLIQYPEERVIELSEDHNQRQKEKNTQFGLGKPTCAREEPSFLMQYVRFWKSSMQLGPTLDPKSNGFTVTPTLEIKKSKFIGYCVDIDGYDSILRALEVLYSSKSIRKAAHTMVAYVYYKDGIEYKWVSEDGEDGAGKVMESLLDNYCAMQKGFFVAVVRWFGGILLGPMRFGIINDVMMQALSIHQVPTKKHKNK